MANSEQEIYRLNKKIKELLAFSEKTFSRNNVLENENSKLKIALDALNDDYTRLSCQNFQLRVDLEKVTLERDNIFHAHEKQKGLINELMKKHNTQFKQLKKLQDIVVKSHDNLLPYAQICVKKRPVTIIGTIAELGNDRLVTEKIQNLENQIKVLEEELQQSYEIIDQLEFEIEEIDYLESENERLQDELTKFCTQTIDIENRIPNQNDNQTTIYKDGNESYLPSHQLVQSEKLVSDKHTRRNLLHKKLEILHQSKSCSLANVENV